MTQIPEKKFIKIVFNCFHSKITIYYFEKNIIVLSMMFNFE
ncbi:hypothetical Protein YC6258_01886 [Gynuella sunshinyii YC6258]|uniref:Uncharacterized protein n=1 Tax=Gynuella sunshinyii YC6258 TaxID=1445510 RepID=A0A0C5V326_9GAMM|nr:hypothetical Protein YC6258_01886 [Gynuella sunshinyii YC6258]